MPTPYTAQIIEEFRANEGRVGGPFEGGDLLLLTTTGARGGAEHTTPLGYVRADGLLLVVASNLGAPSHPAWYHNLLADPSVRVELGTETFEAVALPAEGAVREALFARAVEASPGYGTYQERTTRTLPVVVLERAPQDEGDTGKETGGTASEVTNLADKLVEVHTWLRAQLASLREDAAAYLYARAAAAPGEVPPPGLGFQIRRHCLAFCDALTFHHTSEDGHVFPPVGHHHPRLRPTLDRLREEHVAIARIKDDLLAHLADIGTADPRHFLDTLDGMTKELAAHLDHEEEHLLPVLADVPFPPAAPAGD